MFCILAFVIFLLLYPILGIFSKEYRKLFKKSWACAFKKLTLKPCDIEFSEEIKSKLLADIAFKFPRIARFFDKTATFWMLLFVIFSIWSLLSVLNSGLNLWVYDTCSPTSGQSCSLSGDACGIENPNPPSIFETISRIPDRLKSWNAELYITDSSTFYSYTEGNSVALEIIDPGCTFCKSLWLNIKESSFSEKYNLTYVLYPIRNDDDYQYKHSYLLSTYLESLKEISPENPLSDIPSDWMLLDTVFTGKTENTDLQNAINMLYSEEDVVSFVHDFLLEIGYSKAQIEEIEELRVSEKISVRLNSQRLLVEEEIRTIKIPTIMFGGRRYDRLIDSSKLK